MTSLDADRDLTPGSNDAKPLAGASRGGARDGPQALKTALVGRDFAVQAAMLQPRGAGRPPIQQKAAEETEDAKGEDLSRLDAAPVLRATVSTRAQARYYQLQSVGVVTTCSLTARRFFERARLRDYGFTVDEALAYYEGGFARTQSKLALTAEQALSGVSSEHPELPLHELPVAEIVATANRLVNAPYPAYLQFTEASIESVALSQLQYDGPDPFAGEPVTATWISAQPGLPFDQLDVCVPIADWDRGAINAECPGPDELRAKVQAALARATDALLAPQAGKIARFGNSRTAIQQFVELTVQELATRMPDTVKAGSPTIASIAWNENAPPEDVELLNHSLLGVIGDLEIPYGSGRLPILPRATVQLLPNPDAAGPIAREVDHDMDAGMTLALNQTMAAHYVSLSEGDAYALDLDTATDALKRRVDPWLGPLGFTVQRVTFVEAGLANWRSLSTLTVPPPTAKPEGVLGELSLAEVEGSMTIMAGSEDDQLSYGSNQGGDYTNALTQQASQEGGDDALSVAAERLAGRLLKSQRPTFVKVGGVSGAEGDGASRRAVVVGNERYRQQPQVLGAYRDAASMSSILGGRGFATELLSDLPGGELRTAFRGAVRDSHRDDDLALYFAGHGREGGGLVGVDSQDVPWDELVSLATMAAGKGVDVEVIIDACFAGQATERIKKKLVRDAAGGGRTGDVRVDELVRFAETLRLAAVTLQKVTGPVPRLYTGLRQQLQHLASAIESLGGTTLAEWAQLSTNFFEGLVDASVAGRADRLLTQMRAELEGLATERKAPKTGG